MVRRWGPVIGPPPPADRVSAELGGQGIGTDGHQGAEAAHSVRLVPDDGIGMLRGDEVVDAKASTDERRLIEVACTAGTAKVRAAPSCFVGSGSG